MKISSLWAVVSFAALFPVVLGCGTTATGPDVKGEVIRRQSTADHNGYTAIRVWGSAREMGFAHGYLLAAEIVAHRDLLRDIIETPPHAGAWQAIDATTQAWNLLPAQAIADEIAGVAAGVRAALSSADFGEVDVKRLSLLGDLVSSGCRSHSCWGSLVADPVKTLSSRRADWTGTAIAPEDMDFYHHLIIAYDPDDASLPRWVNFTYPGIISTGTCVSEYGTLGAIHDYQDVVGGAAPTDPVLSRSIALRYMISTQTGTLDWIASSAEALIGSYYAYANTFINYLIPEGHALAFRAARGGFYGDGSDNPRMPGSVDYIVCSNRYQDGAVIASDSNSSFAAYYATTDSKTLQSHWNLLHDDPANVLCQLSLAYRERGDMTLWYEGRTNPSGTASTTGKLTFEWSELF